MTLQRPHVHVKCDLKSFRKKKNRNVSVDFWPVRAHAAALRFDYNCDEKQKAKKQKNKTCLTQRAGVNAASFPSEAAGKYHFHMVALSVG